MLGVDKPPVSTHPPLHSNKPPGRLLHAPRAYPTSIVGVGGLEGGQLFYIKEKSGFWVQFGRCQHTHLSADLLSYVGASCVHVGRRVAM